MSVLDDCDSVEIHRRGPNLSKIHNIDEMVVTTLKLAQFRFVWVVDTFASFQSSLASPVFEAICNNHKSKWRILLSDDQGDLLICLKNVSVDDPNIDYKVSLSGVNSSGGRQYVNTKRGVQFEGIDGEVLVHTLRIREENIRRVHLLPQNTLTVVCDISLIDGIVNTEESGLKDQLLIQSTVLDDFSKLLMSEKFSDITLVVAHGSEELEFHVHKAILSTRSEVFAAMFDHELEESKTNRVIIEDIEANVVREMLHFIYTGKPVPENMAGELLAAADKYALEDLKQLCVSILTKYLNIDTAIESLLLANLHCSDLVITRIMKFIKANVKDIFRTEGWKKLRNNYPHLCIDILEDHHNNI